MKIIASLLANFIVITSLCMDDKQAKKLPLLQPYTTLQELIENNITHPNLISEELNSYPAKTLVSYHYKGYNNLLHCIVYNLVTRKNSLPNFDILIDDYKPLLRTLVYNNGLYVDEVNDDHATPLFIAYKAQKIEDFKEVDAEIEPLINFFEEKLQASPTYFSIAPELRTLKKIAWEFVTCQCCPLEKQE